MSNRPESEGSKNVTLRAVLIRIRDTCVHNWGLKLICIALAVLLWGGQISQDPNLTRDKSFSDVTINRTGEDSLIRNGLIVVSGLNELAPIQMRAAVPQRQYNLASPANYNVRVDLSRITAPGEQMLPIISTPSATYGQITWLSQSEITVQVDSYATKRRVPVELDTVSRAPAGFYAPPASRDPALVSVSGPQHLIDQVVKCVTVYDLSMLQARAGTQSFALPFSLRDAQGREVDQSLVSVTSESVRLDSVLIEQQLHPLKTVDISLQGITQGEPAEGYRVKSVTASPGYLSVAGSSELLKSLKLLNVTGHVDITGAKESLIRAVRIDKPQGALFVSEEAVYVTIEIEPVGGNPEVPQ